MIREIEQLRREEDIVLANTRDRDERERYTGIYVEERMRTIALYDVPPPPYTEREERAPSYGQLTPPTGEERGKFSEEI